MDLTAEAQSPEGPRSIPLNELEEESHDSGVSDRAVLVNGIRWAMVEYGAGCGRANWCATPHSGYVVAGSIRYEFEDGRSPLAVGAGNAFLLTATPRHRGLNAGREPARLFLIDALPAPPG
ncbi:MAG: hypothetical protein M3Z13_06945 [Candidatus Dormibacteraeota bacterium]|nr:hypothetical protein [Candidatus Dormibacteraeota bacterium]